MSKVLELDFGATGIDEGLYYVIFIEDEQNLYEDIRSNDTTVFRLSYKANPTIDLVYEAVEIIPRDIEVGDSAIVNAYILLAYAYDTYGNVPFDLTFDVLIGTESSPTESDSVLLSMELTDLGNTSFEWFTGKFKVPEDWPHDSAYIHCIMNKDSVLTEDFHFNNTSTIGIRVYRDHFRPSSDPAHGKTYLIRSRISDKAIEPFDDNYERSVRQITSDGGPYQLWTLQEMSDQVFQVVNYATGRNLSKKLDSKYVAQYKTSSESYDNWSFNLNENQYFNIVNVTTGKYLEVVNMMLNDGAAIQVADSSGERNQDWMITEVVITEIESKNSQSSVIAYPNPSSGLINFSFNGNQDHIVRLVDVRGKVTIEKTIDSLSGTVIEDLSQGLYLYSIWSKTEGKQASGKILVR